MVRYNVSFEGRVQGVGFRQTARQIASSHRVGGWVRNEADGSVRMAVEGTGQEVERFLDSLKKSMDAFITRTNVTKEPARGEFSGFTIRY